MTTIDFGRLDAAITYAHEHPKQFNMNTWLASWECGTTACLAGTVALQAGWTPVWELNGGPSDGATAVEVTKGSDCRFVGEVAEELLGFDEQAESDFFYAEDLDEVIRLRNEYAAEAGIPERTWGTP